MKKISFIHCGWLLLLTVFISACEKSAADKPEKPRVTPGSYQDKSVISWTVDGASYSCGGNALYSPSVNRTGVASQYEDDKYNISVVFNGKTEGVFKMGASNQAGKATITFMNTATGKEYGNTYVENCQQGGFIYTEGEVKVTRVGKPGDYVEGTFSATLYDVNHCTSKASVKVKGEFKMLRVGGE